MKRLLALIIVIALLAPFTSFAAISIAQPYGGKLSYVFYCTCSQTYLLTFKRAGGTKILDYVPFTQGYQSYNLPEPGVNAVGNYYKSPIPLCYVYAGVTCIPIKSQGVVSFVTGTSIR